MAIILPQPLYTALNAAGSIISGATFTFYLSGGSTLLSAYTSSALTVAHPNPLTADAAGRFPAIYLDDSKPYRVVLKDASGVVVRDTDPINSPSAGALLAASGGSALVGYTQGTGASARLVQDVLRELPVSIVNFGTGNDPGALINAAIAFGATNIYIPQATNWVWTTTATIPALWRGRIWSDSVKSDTYRILARTGHTFPCIDMQGAILCTIEGLHLFGDDSLGTAPAVGIFMGRMPTGASAGNHIIRNNLIEGQFAMACMYNLGSEETIFRDNYWSIYGSPGGPNYRQAAIVYLLTEEAFFSALVTKAARTAGLSCSAIRHPGDVVKNTNAGGSAFYFGANVNDIDLECAYGYTAPGSAAFITEGGYSNRIALNISRVEIDKSTPLVSAPNSTDSGLISLVGGSYLRSGAQDSTKYLIDIGGTAANNVTINIAAGVCFTDSSGGGIEDIYLVRSARRTQAHIDLTASGVVAALLSSKININTLIASTIYMGQRANLTVGTYALPTELHFFGDSTQTYDLHGGLNLATGALFNGGIQVVGSRQAAIASPAAGTTIDTQARTAIDALRAALIAHGLTS
jgi:hypothetical protein